MDTLNLYEAKTQLSQLVDRAANGEEIIIAKAGKPMARLMPLAKPVREVKFGTLAGKVWWVGDNFDDPLPDDLLAAFNGESR